MRTKKINFNGKSGELVNFLTQQIPKRYLASYKVLLDLKYPIADSQVFYDQLEKIEENELVKELLVNTFTPRDFGLESPINALEKFQLNLRIKSIPPNEFYNAPLEYNYGRVPVPEYSMYTPYKGYPTGMPIENNAPSMEQYLPIKRPANYWPEWKMEKEYIPTQMNKELKEWEFGKDIIGDVATSLFTEMISKGIREDYAYNFAREKEVACRSLLPTFEIKLTEKALFIFATHFILLGKNIRQSFLAARLFLNKTYFGFDKAEPKTRYYEDFVPKMKKEFVEPVM